MSINKTGLNTVGKLDQYLGIIPSISAFNAIPNADGFLMKSYVFNLRRLVAMGKIFFGETNGGDMIKICNDQTAEYNLFGQVMVDHVSDNKLQEILISLEREQFVLETKMGNDGCFDVKKNPKIQNLEFLDDAADLILSEPYLDSDSFLGYGMAQKSLDNLFEKMTLTMELLKQLRDKKLMDDLNSTLVSAGYKYQNKLNVPLVGSMKGHPDSVVIYLLSYFESGQKFSELPNVNLQMKTIFEFLFKINAFKNLVKKIANVGGMVDNCFIRKMITVSESDKSLCLVHCIVFKNSLFLNDSVDFMINLKKDIEKNLKWDVFFNTGELVVHPLK